MLPIKTISHLTLQLLTRATISLKATNLHTLISPLIHLLKPQLLSQIIILTIVLTSDLILLKAFLTIMIRTNQIQDLHLPMVSHHKSRYLLPLHMPLLRLMKWLRMELLWEKALLLFLAIFLLSILKLFISLKKPQVILKRNLQTMMYQNVHKQVLCFKSNQILSKSCHQNHSQSNKLYLNNLRTKKLNYPQK